MNIFVAPFVNALVGFSYLFNNNLGWSIVVVTILIRVLLMPLVIPSFKSAQKMRELQPKLNKLKEKYKNDKKGLAAAQMELYKQEGVNPLSGCLPQILQIAVLLVFFSAFTLVTDFAQGKGDFTEINKQLFGFFQIGKDFKFNIDFLGSNLADVPSKIFKSGINWQLILPLFLLVGSGILQFFSAKVMMPETKTDESVVAKTKDKEDDMMAAMRTQSLYVMPIMTIVIGWNFSIGLLLYWFVNSAVMIGQQLIIGRKNKH